MTRVEVQTGKITKTTLRHYLTAYGTVQAQPALAGQGSGSARVMATSQGLIAQSHCVLGQRVERGAILFSLDDRAVEAAVARARAAVDVAERYYQREDELVKAGAASKQLLEAQQQRLLAKADLDNALTRRALLEVAAPISGTVTALNIQPGEVADPMAPLAELVDLDHLVVATLVPSSELQSIRVGQAATVHDGGTTSPDAPVLHGSVMFVSVGLDPKSDMGTVLVALSAGSPLRPGQFARVQIVVEEQRDALAVPVEAITAGKNGTASVAIVDGDQAVQHPVQVGLRDGGLVQIEGNGVHADQTVITSGAYALPQQTAIRVANK